MKSAYAPSPKRIPELDGLRVLLVFVVAWYHFWQQSWLTPAIGSYSLDFLVRSGYMPVDGTILLSGFLLFLPYARSMLMEEPLPDRRWFYRRRVMRIVPSFYFITLVMLFLVALPWGLYYSPKNLVKDVFMHFTFTFTFDPYTYISTPIGVASWTLAIEMQAYLLFPFIARRAMRKPAATLLGMTALAWLWRGWCVWAFTDYGMVVNQLPSFLDVYALGMAAALLYVKCTQLWQKVKRPILWEIGATAAVAAAVLLLEKILRAQAYYHGNIQAGQMIHRFPLAALLAVLVTYLIEKPGAKLLKRLFEKGDARRKARYMPAAQAIAAHVGEGETVVLANLPQDAADAVVEALGEKPKLVVKEGKTVEEFDIIRE